MHSFSQFIALEIISKAIDPSRLLRVLLEEIDHDPKTMELIDRILDGQLAKALSGNRYFYQEQAEMLSEIFKGIPARLFMGQTPVSKKSKDTKEL